MDAAEVDHRQAILRVARDIRAAVTARRDATSESLEAYEYDNAVGDRLPQAIAFLRAIKAADDSYYRARSLALERFARQVEDWKD